MAVADIIATCLVSVLEWAFKKDTRKRVRIHETDTGEDLAGSTNRLNDHVSSLRKRAGHPGSVSGGRKPPARGE